MEKGRRNFIKWTPPLIVAVSLPKSGFAQNISGHHETAPKGKSGDGEYHRSPEQPHRHSHKWWDWHRWF
jgi:hypothetical protein